MYENGILVKGDTIAILAEEVKARKRTFFEQEIPSFNKIFNFDISKMFDLHFYHYTTFAKNKIIPKAIACDEVETSFSPENIKCFAKPIKYIMGFTGTTAATAPVYRNKSEQGFRQSDFDTKRKMITDFANKGQCFEIFCPIVYEYNMEQGISDGILSDFRTTIIEHELSNTEQVQITKNWKGSEKKYYEWWKQFAFKTPEVTGRVLGQQLPRFLASYPSKLKMAKKIIPHLKDRKTLIFSKELSFLRELTDNVSEDYYVIDGQRYNTVKDFRIAKGISGRLNKTHYKTKEKVLSNVVADRFDADEINIIGSANRLQRGITLKGLNTLLIFINSKQYHTLVQQLGKHNLLN